MGNSYYSSHGGMQTFTLSATSPRRRKLTTQYAKGTHEFGDDQLIPVQYVRIENPNGQVIYVALNGSDATATLATGATFPTATPNFRIHPHETRTFYTKATSLSALAGTSATAIYIEVGRQ